MRFFKTLGQVVAGWLLADAVGGILHYIEDKQLLPDFLDKHIGAPNRLHHLDPLEVTRDNSFLRRNSTTWAANLPVLALLYRFTGPTPFFFAAAAGGLITYEAHRWAHAPRLVPGWAKPLQEMGIIQSAKHHARHHAPPQNMSYCVLSNFVNPLVDLGMFRFR